MRVEGGALYSVRGASTAMVSVVTVGTCVCVCGGGLSCAGAVLRKVGEG